MRKLAISILSFISVLVLSLSLVPNSFALENVVDVQVSVHDSTGVENQSLIQGTLGDIVEVDFSTLENYSFNIFEGVVDLQLKRSFQVSESIKLHVILQSELEVVTVFLDTNGDLLESVFTTDESVVEYSKALPTKPGYEFHSWQLLSSSDAKKQIYKAVYTKTNVEEMEINVVGGTLLPEVVKYNDLAVVQANSDLFAYWADEDGQVVSYEKTYTFSALSNMTLVAVEKENVVPQSVVYLRNVTGIRTGHQSFVGQVDLLNGSSLVEYGMIVSNEKEVITLESANIIKVPSQSINAHNEFLRSFVEGQYKTFRAYAVIKDAQGNKTTIYSDNNFSVSNGSIYFNGFESAKALGYLRTGTSDLSVTDGLIWTVTTGSTSDSGILWNYDNGQDANITEAQGSNVARIHGKNNTTLTSEVLDYVSLFKLDAKRYGSRSDGKLKVAAVVDGVEVKTFELDLTNQFKTFELDFNLSNVQIRLIGTGERTNIDNLEIFSETNTRLYQVNYFNGNEKLASESLAIGSKVTRVEEILGHTFAGWYLDQEFSVPFTGNVEKSVNLYAKFNVNSYTASFVLNGAVESYEPISYVFGEAFELPANPTKEGYVFAGWFEDAQFTKEYALNDGSKAGNHSIYAKWDAVEYTLVFNSNGGSEVASITQGFGTNVLEPEHPTKANVVFVGWFLDAELLEAVQWPMVMPLNGATVYAKWLGLESFDITFDINYNEGTDPEAQNLETGELVVKPTVADREGFELLGWTLDLNADPVVLWDFDQDVVTNNMVLYAVWEEAKAADPVVTEYTFNSKSWAADKKVDGVSVSGNDWKSGKEGLFNASQGVQITSNLSGANATTTVTFTNVISIEIMYSTNSSKGAGSIVTKVGTTTVQTFTPKTIGGVTTRSAGVVAVADLSGTINITVNCTTNSLYIHSIKITTQAK